MHKLFHTIAALSVLLPISMAAHAADMTARPVPYAPPPFSWMGLYLGGNIGGAWANRDVSDSFLDGKNGVFIGGGQLGFNWQVSNFVFGLEADFDGANNNNTGTVFIPTLGTVQVTSNDRWVMTL